jgi:hypothetical protein
VPPLGGDPGGVPPGAGPDIERIRVQSLDHLATLCRMRGRYDEAERLSRRALALAEEEFGPEDGEVASILNNLAVLHEYQARYDEAEPLY